MSFRLKPVQPASPPQFAYLLHRIRIYPAETASNELTHGLFALLQAAQVTVSNRLPNQFGHRGPPRFRLRVQSVPELLIQVELSSPHDV
mgnify:CR=1 FL=1